MQAEKRIVQYLERHGKSCIISESGTALPPHTECALVLGGDGTLLRAAKKVLNEQIPLIGINLGTLGYLAEVDVKGIEPALNHLMADEYTIENRMMLKGTVYHKWEEISTDVALNDIVLTRRKPLRTYLFKNYVNGAFLNQYKSDGIVVSTATGSTGYSLSVGGPIVSPVTSLILMTPLAPHTLNSRTIILPSSDEVTIEIAEGKTGYTEEVVNVSFDGDERMMLNTGDYVKISKSRKYTRILKINDISFLEVLRSKMADTL